MACGGGHTPRGDEGSRCHRLICRPGLLGIDGNERAGLRILLLTVQPTSDELTELVELVRRRSDGRVVVEDPFSTLDLANLGLTLRRLPVIGSVP